MITQIAPGFRVPVFTGSPPWLLARMEAEIRNGHTAECHLCGRRIPESLIEGHGGRTWKPVCKSCASADAPPVLFVACVHPRHEHDTGELAFGILAGMLTRNARARGVRLHQKRRRSHQPATEGRMF